MTSRGVSADPPKIVPDRTDTPAVSQIRRYLPIKKPTAMKHTEDSIRNIKKSLAEMWSLVQSQVEKSSAALLDGNKELAHEITSREKLVDSYELTVDRECENFFALLTPVAVDLRMILSIIKINNNLERIGDFADGIAHFVIHNQTEKINTELLGQLQIREMFDEVICMLKLCKSALANEDSHMAGKVFAKDTVVDRLNTENVHRLATYMEQNPDAILDGLYLHSAIRRIERIGDRCNNIAEDIIFYLDAKVMKHLHTQDEQ